MAATVDDGWRRIGENVRAARHYRGKSLETVAGLVGRSKGWLSKVENGTARLERRSDIAALAEALGVSASDLLGEPTPVIRPRERAHGDVVKLREVLLETALDDPLDVPTRPLGVILQLVAGPIMEARRTTDYAKLTSELPAIMAELHVHAVTGDERDQIRALDGLVEVCTAATFVLRYLGQVDLAWIAAERAGQAAQLVGEPTSLGAAAFAKAHSRPSASLSRGLREAVRRADELEAKLDSTRRANEIYGMLQLSAALACEVRGDHAGAGNHAVEAQRIAARIGENASSWQSFGPANVGVWRAMLANEAGEPGAALKHAATVDVSALLNHGRKAELWIERGRAHAMLGQDAQAIRALRQAEILSVLRVHKNPLIRELVAHLLDRARREAGGRELRGLAWRMNLI